MHAQSAPGYQPLLQACDDLVGWTAALWVAHGGNESFLIDWLPLAAALVHRANVLDTDSGGRRAFELVVERCNAMLGQFEWTPLPPHAYIRAAAMRHGSMPSLSNLRP